MRVRLVLKARSPQSAQPEEAPVLGKTKRGHPVPAGPAVTKYNDGDHAEAGARHTQAAAYHRVKHALHRQMSDEDSRWQRSEEHHEDAERHGTLADHHEDLARFHLTAGGKATSAALDVRAGKPVVSEATPAPGEERKRAVEELKKRPTRLPAVLSERDREAYGKIAQGETE